MVGPPEEDSSQYDAIEENLFYWEKSILIIGQDQYLGYDSQDQYLGYDSQDQYLGYDSGLFQSCNKGPVVAAAAASYLIED